MVEALSAAELAFEVGRVEQNVDAQAKQAQLDALALARAVKQLHPDPNSPVVAEQELTEAIQQASPSVKAQIFYQAQKARADNWRNDKPLMERTIPIFKALVASDSEARFHQNYGQLGYALKDQRSPRPADAEAALTTAIRIRDSAGEGRWWHLYEYNRAVCRIMQDPEFVANAASSPAVRARIIADLRVLTDREVELLKQSPVSKWLTLNNVTPEEVRGVA